jgi:hypothetical protein
MCSKMPFPYSGNQRDPFRDFQVWTLLYPLCKVNTPLAGNIVDCDHPEAGWDGHEALADSIVNVQLSKCY